MAERRALIEGLATAENIDPDLAEDFINNGKPRQAAKTSTRVPEATKQATRGDTCHAAASAVRGRRSPGIRNIPFDRRRPRTGGARVRTELAAALKRASLERQLQGIQPNSVQDILEESLELWLLKHGYLK